MSVFRAVNRSADYLIMSALCVLALTACGGGSGDSFTTMGLPGGTHTTADAGKSLDGGVSAGASDQARAEILASAQTTQPQVVGRIDQIAYINDQWTIRGWACEVGSGAPVAVDVYLGNARSYTTRAFADQPSEPEVAEACKDKVGSKHRFVIPMSPVSTPSEVIVRAGAAPLTGSGIFRLPAAQGAAGVL